MFPDSNFDVRRIQQLIGPPDAAGCRPWLGYRVSSGHGQYSFLIAGRRVRSGSHRLLYQWVHGLLPDDINVCHTCDNPWCMEITHLFAGTQADNLADMHAKQRHAYGERMGTAKLTEEAVRRARHLYDEGMLQREIADLLGVTQTNVGMIVRRETWAHVA